MDNGLDWIMNDTQEVTAREVLIALNGHVSACTFMNKLTVAFMGAILSVLIVFAGYSYVNGQALTAQLAQARITQLQATQSIPDKTAAAVTAKLAPTTQ